jgi:Flp pilus assembly protein CpaB
MSRALICLGPKTTSEGSHNSYLVSPRFSAPDGGVNYWLLRLVRVMHRKWLLLVAFLALVLDILVNHQVSRTMQSGAVPRKDIDTHAGPKALSDMQSLIPPGMRAVSIRVTEVVPVTRGNRVDVWLTSKAAGGGKPATTTIIENICVLASEQLLESNSAGEQQIVHLITLLVSPEDAYKLTMATSKGRIKVVPRSSLDQQQPIRNGPLKPIPPEIPQSPDLRRST